MNERVKQLIEILTTNKWSEVARRAAAAARARRAGGKAGPAGRADRRWATSESVHAERAKALHAEMGPKLKVRGAKISSAPYTGVTYEEDERTGQDRAVQVSGIRLAVKTTPGGATGRKGKPETNYMKITTAGKGAGYYLQHDGVGEEYVGSTPAAALAGAKKYITDHVSRQAKSSARVGGW